MELKQQFRSRALVIAGWALTGLIAAGIAVPAVAAPLALRPGMGGVPDLGAIRCETFNAMYPAGPNGLRQAILYWTEGYVYAKTGKTMDEFLASPGMDIWDFGTLTDHVVAFCQAQPEVPVPLAVMDLWARMNSGKAEIQAN
jgi:hypothetical protein